MTTIKTDIVLRWQSQPENVVFNTTIDLSIDIKKLEEKLLQLVFNIADLCDTCPLEFEFLINNEVFYIISDIEAETWSISK